MKMVFVFLIALTSCKFRLSPYSTDVPKLNLNSVNLKKIQEQESQNPYEFRVAFLSDTHNHYKELKKAVKYLNQNGPYDFVIIGGDTSIIGLGEEFLASKKFIENLNYPFLMVVGNHDLLSNGEIIFKKLYGLRDFSFTYKNVNFIIFDSNNWESSRRVPDYNFVKTNLKNMENILISHVPLNDTDRFSNDEINQWIDLTTLYSIPFMFAGHNHNPVEEIFGSSLLITIGSPPKGILWELEGVGGVVSHKKVSF